MRTELKIATMDAIIATFFSLFNQLQEVSMDTKQELDRHLQHAREKEREREMILTERNDVAWSIDTDNNDVV